ncbi:MAG: MATE family efflux transporter, partial [Oscillospiraceae bacterium]
ALGVPGAAIATVIARFSELGVMMIAIYAKKLVQAAKPRELFSFTRSMLVNYFKGATPVIINEMAWAIGATLYTWVFAKTSVQAMVIMTIVQNVERLLLVFFHGGGNAGGIIIGNAVGAGKNESAYIYAKKLCFLSVATGLVISMIFIFCRPLILSMYNITPEVYAQTNQILLIMAILMNLKALSFFLIVGVFRNGGDVKASLIIDVGSVWLVGVPLVLLTGLVLNLPLIIVYSMLCVEEIVRITISLKRFKSKKWIRNLVST